VRGAQINRDSLIARTDLAALADVVAPVGTGGIVYVMRAKQRVALSDMPNFPYPILESGMLDPDTVVAVAPNGIAASISGPPQIAESKQATVHESTTPTGDGTLGDPQRGLFQTDASGLRLIWPVSWMRRSDKAVAWVASVTW
jgi:hypothetical protein